MTDQSVPVMLYEEQDILMPKDDDPEELPNVGRNSDRPEEGEPIQGQYFLYLFFNSVS